MEPVEKSTHQSRRKRYSDLTEIAWKRTDMAEKTEAVWGMIALAKAEKDYTWLSDIAERVHHPQETRQAAIAELGKIGPEWVPGKDTEFFSVPK